MNSANLNMNKILSSPTTDKLSVSMFMENVEKQGSESEKKV